MGYKKYPVIALLETGDFLPYFSTNFSYKEKSLSIKNISLHLQHFNEMNESSTETLAILERMQLQQKLIVLFGSLPVCIVITSLKAI